MFTGIVEATGRILENKRHRLAIERPRAFRGVAIGSSISVAGVCLTVVKKTNTALFFDVVDETLARTTLGELKRGDRVNLERSLKAGECLEGHIVQGHVEGTGVVTAEKRTVDSRQRTAVSKKNLSAARTIAIRLPARLSRSILSKGSIAVDGVSLTVASIKGTTIVIALIPHTCKVTTLGALKKGDHVNIETDILARYARRGRVK